MSKEQIIYHANEIIRLTTALPEPPPDPPDPPVNTVKVSPGDNVGNAIASLDATGGLILARPGQYEGAITIPTRTGSDPIIIRSDTDALPSPGQRINPSYEPALAMFQNTGRLESTINAQGAGARGIHFVGVGFGPLYFDRTMVAIGNEKRFLTRPEDRPSDFLFDRVFFKGDPVNGQHCAVRMNGKQIRVINSHTQDIIEYRRDHAAFGGWNGTEDILIENNYIEAGAQNVMFGGSDCASELMVPRNVTIRKNLFSKNYAAWWSLERRPTVKCHFELKNIIGCLFESNVLQYNWAADWPHGTAISVKASNQENGNPFAQCSDVIIRNNYVRDVGAFLTYVGKDDGPNSSDWNKNFQCYNNIVVRMNIPGSNYRGTGHAYRFTNCGPDMRVGNNTVLGNATGAFLHVFLDTGLTSNGSNFQFVNNAVIEADYGIFTSGGLGKAALDLMFPMGYQFQGQAIRDDSARWITYPAQNGIVAPSGFHASFADSGKLIAGSAADLATRGLTTNGAPVGADYDAIIAGLNDAI